VNDLTLDEKAALTSGSDMWSVPGVERLGLAPVLTTDGPNGVRGSDIAGRAAPATCLPCGVAVGASWDPALAERLGAVLGAQARGIGARFLLAPTVNLPRSPLWGRSFECYSEDPLLSGRLAVGFVKGVQSQGVAATVKHLVCNETEHERMSISSEVDARTLRELYLLPFELAVTEGGARAVMTSYNRLNGRWCAEDEQLLTGVLRGEWGFQGIVMTDWWAVGSTVGSAEAGLDLQMPGPGRWFGAALAHAVQRGDVDEALLDAVVDRRLRVQRDLESTVPVPVEDAQALAREAAVEGTVLLTNAGLLPLDRDRLRILAVIGPNADRAVIMGGGSAGLVPEHLTSPLAALRAVLPDVQIDHAPGCVIDKVLPVAQLDLTVDYFAQPDLSGPVVHRAQRQDAAVLHLRESPAEPVPFASFSFRAVGTLTPEVSGDHEFSLVEFGRARVLVDGVVVVDGTTTDLAPGDAFYGFGSEEMRVAVPLLAGVSAEVVVEWVPGEATAVRGARLGHRPPVRADLLEQAVALAARADAVVLVVGTDAEWESEGNDRTSLHLPGDQDALVRRVTSANARTAVVVNAGAPVAMDWADAAGAVLQVWFGGQEMGPALADVLLGDAEPGGRLPVSVPERLEHGPAYGSFPGANGRTPYAEGLLAGYRWYDTRRLPVRFPFGHGLGYTTFDVSAPRVVAGAATGEAVMVAVDVTNTGSRPGAEVVQLYVQPVAPRLPRARKELKAFAKVRLQPGERREVALELPPRAFAYWDDAEPDRAAVQSRQVLPRPASLEGSWDVPGWRVDPGAYVLEVARSAADTLHAATVVLHGDRVRLSKAQAS